MEIKALDSGALVGSITEAQRAIGDKALKYPLLIIPQGENTDEDHYIVNDERELRNAFGRALKAAYLGKVHVISHSPKILESGIYQAESHLK